MLRTTTRGALCAVILTSMACENTLAPPLTTPPTLAVKPVLQPTYVIEALPPFADGTDSWAYAINDLGQIVGYSSTGSGSQHAALWTGLLAPTDLGTLGGDFSKAEGISNSGFVTGMSTLISGEGHAFRWDAVNGMIDVGTLGGSDSYGYDAGEGGEVVGSSYLADGYTIHAFLWTSAGGIRDLGTLPGHSFSLATGINVLGDVVGISSDQGASWNAVLWPSAGGIVDLGVVPGAWMMQALAIADDGGVAGQMDMLDGTSHAFYWKGGVLNDIGITPTGSTFAGAAGVNNKGTLVGYGVDPTLSCLYCPAVQAVKTGFQFLPRLDPLADAVAESVNAPGVIVGASMSNGTTQAVRWRSRKP